MNPKRKMNQNQRAQAWENERKQQRQDHIIEEGSGGIHRSVNGTKVGEDKRVKDKKKKKK